MRAAAAFHSNSLEPRDHTFQSVRLVSVKTSKPLKSEPRAYLTCMAHPAGGSYSVWAMPRGSQFRTGELAERLQQDIDRLAAAHEAPSFEPHVTLLGGTQQSEEDALRITADLAQSVQAYRLDLQDVSYGSIFHQCVYVRCKPTDAAVDAAKRTRQAFGHPADTQYMPHVSLLYSDVPLEKRAEVAEKEQQRMFSDYKMPAYSFDVDSISLWYTIGEDKTLHSWRLVKEFALHP